MDMVTDGSDAKSRSARVKGRFLLAAHAPVWVLVLLGIFLLGKTGTVKAGGASEWFAVVVGLSLISFGITAAAIRASADFLPDPDDADDLREQGRALILGSGALIAAGSSLILLSLSGPGRLVPAAAGLICVLFLNILSTVLAARRWRLLDEMNRAVAYEAGYLAFAWLSVIGGTWAMLAHLGFAASPAPLDWVTMFFGFNFFAGLIALARRGGFERL